MSYRADYSLRAFNTFGFDCSATAYAPFHSEQGLKTLLDLQESLALPRYVLGRGSNILLTRPKLEGFVLQNAIMGREVLEAKEDFVDLLVGGGESWPDLVAWTLAQGWGGLENLSLIPGSVGAAPIQNIGAYGVELADRLLWVEAMHLESREIFRLKVEDCQFSYRNSLFKQYYLNKVVILRLALRLYPAERSPLALEYGALPATLEQLNLPLSPQGISQAVIFIRQSKLPDPRHLGNAGSFFQNPSVSKYQCLELLDAMPDLPYYPSLDPDMLKISAAYLIEQAGWKGYRREGIGVHERQALVLVHYGRAQGQELLTLAKEIQEDVYRKFAVVLKPEVNIW